MKSSKYKTIGRENKHYKGDVILEIYEKLHQWRAQLYNPYDSKKKSGFLRLSIQFLVKEILDSKIMKGNFEAHKRFLVEKYEKKLGLRITDGSSLSTLYEIFVENVYTIFQDFLPKSESTILDIGAQHGYYSLLCSKQYKCAKIYAFEPLPRNYKIMLSNLELNGTNNVETYQAAVAEESGYLFLSEEGDMANIFGEGQQFKCDSLTVDSLNLNLTEIDIVKIDVEGSEYKVLQGAKRTLCKFRPKVIVETHSKFLRKQVEDFLNTLGYKLVHEGRTMVVDQPEMDMVQNLFFSNMNSPMESCLQNRRDIV